MRKRLLAILFSVVVLMALIPTALALDSTSTATLTVKASKTTVRPGDEVEFSVELTQSGDIAAVEAYVKLPDGLTLVKDSFVAATDKASLGWDDFTVDEGYLMIYGYGSKGYEGTPLTLATFKCTVDADAAGSLSVELYDLVALDALMEDKNPTSVSATLEVEIPVTGVTLDRNTLALDTGDNKTAALVATVTPDLATNQAVTWKSSDESVATVTDGVVNAVKHGTATITVTTVDGALSDTCIVTVTCVHADKTPVAAKAATCSEAGWEAYATCDACGQIFTADGLTALSEIPAVEKDSSNHTAVRPFEASEPTCKQQGHDAYKKCMACGVVTEGSDTLFYGEHAYGTLIPATSGVHTADELTPAVEAHYQCSVCEKYFTAEKVETTLAGLTGAVPSHSYGDWQSDADQHWKQCSCGKKSEVGAHRGGTATPEDKAKCSICQASYGDFAEPEETTTEPETTVTEPETTVTEPETTVTEPETTVTEPETTVTEPETTVTEPETTVTEPEETTADPEVTTAELEETGSEKKRRGCGSVIGTGTVLVLSVISLATVVISKKKED